MYSLYIYTCMYSPLLSFVLLQLQDLKVSEWIVLSGFRQYLKFSRKTSPPAGCRRCGLLGLPADRL